ncbi:MAG: hypothetical protein J4473_04040 [Candidatus Aenigmarchaeota archaeon]|nr:hypothetical protein [Candidatus Aenigmarchaeota archaeon]
MKCNECGGKMLKKVVDYIFLDENLGRFSAEVCSLCGEQVFEEGVIEKVTQNAKEKGLWNLGSSVKVSRIGNSMGIVVTKKLAQFLRLKPGETVTIYPENRHRIIVDIENK